MRVKPRLAGILCVLAVLVALPRSLRAQGAGSSAPATGAIDIPYQKFVLDNGLALIVHEDHKAPIVAVNVWYHVGSKIDPEGNLVLEEPAAR